MNVSFQDTYNLGWKVCSVIAGIASPKILRTYESERRQVALELLKNDQAANKYYSLLKADAKPTEPREDLQTFRNKMYGFLSGVAVEYGHSLLVQKEGIRGGKGNIVNSTGDCEIVTGERDGAETSTHQELARRIPMGQRMPPFKVLNHASARPTNIAELLPSTGHWRILVFAGDLTVSTQFDRLKKLGTALAGHRSFFQRYSRPGWQPIELFTIIAGARDDTPLMTLPPIFHPYDEELGWDYSRVFSDEVDVHDGRGDAYERYGIDRRVGCVVCCRPDQHVGYIGALDDDASLEEYFGRVMG